MRNKFVKGLALALAVSTAFTGMPASGLLGGAIEAEAASNVKITGKKSVYVGKNNYTLKGLTKGGYIKIAVAGKAKKNVTVNKKTGKLVKVNAKKVKLTVKSVKKAAGKAYTLKVTAYNKKGKKLKTVKISSKVYNKTTSLTLKAAKSSIKVGEKTTIKATVKPAKNTMPLTYKTSNAKVATVKNGTVTGVGEGTATITVTSGTVKKTVKITVTKKAADTSSKPADTSSKVADTSSKPADTSSQPADSSSAADTSSKPADSSSAAQDVAVTGVTLDNTTPKVGDTITAKCAPEGANNIASVAWYLLSSADEATSDSTKTSETGTSLKVTSPMVEKFIKVVVTDTEGKTFTATTTAPVANDATEDVSIIDVMGLQSDGTAIIGDRLRVSFGASFGAPTALNWYKDGAVIETNAIGDTVSTHINLDITPSRGTGTYYATVADPKGVIHKTNEIVVTNKEEQGVIKSWTIEDDYTDGTDITYATTDTTAVATVTLSKNYKGSLQVWKKSDSKYSGAVDKLTTADTPAAQWSTAANARVNVVPSTTDTLVASPKTDATAILTADQATNYDVENMYPGAGVGHINADGTVTYKFVVNGGLTRGADYVVTFDQDSITGDTPGTGTANVFATAATAPYVIAPAKIAVTKISNGNKPEVTFYDKDGAALNWLGKNAREGYDPAVPVLTKNTTIAREARKTLKSTGFETAAIYSNTVKANDPTASTATGLDTSLVTTGNTLLSGVWTADANATDTAYWFAKVTTTAGVYAENSLEIVSEAAPLAQDSATKINLVQDKNTATSAVVSFENLRCDGTVYIVRGASYGTDHTDYISTAEEIYKGYNAIGGELVTASSSVPAGAKEVTVASALGKYTGVVGVQTNKTETVFGDKYIAVFIPNDEVNYGRVYTSNKYGGAIRPFNSNDKMYGTSDGTVTQGSAPLDASDEDSCGVWITQKPSSLKYDSSGSTNLVNTMTVSGSLPVTMTTSGCIIESSQLIAYDQFGNKMTTTTEDGVDATTVVAKDNNITNAERGTAKIYVLDETGQTAIWLNMAPGNVDPDDGFTINVLGSQITVINKNTVAIPTTLSTFWEIKFGTNKIYPKTN